MAIQINNGFNLKASIPLDARFVFQDMTDLKAMPTHELYVGLLTYVIKEHAFYVYNGTAFEEFKSKSDYFLDPVETAANLSSIQSPKKGAICLVKDEKRFYTYVGDTKVTGTVTTGDVTTVTNDASIPMTVSLIFADDPSTTDEFPASIDLSKAAQVIDNYVDGWAPVTCKAIEISYDNATSKLQADNVQAAIDELAKLFQEAPSPVPPVPTPGDLPKPSDSKPGDIVVVQNPKAIYVFDGKNWVEIKAKSEFYLDPVATKADLQLDPVPSYGTICMVKDERAFYVYVNATSAELNGQPAKDAWICTKTKAQDIPFNNSGTGLTGTTINQVITEINTTLTERTILDWKDDPTTVDVGGIKAGFQTPADGIDIADFLYNMTHPFVYPNLSLTLTPPAGVYEKNTTLTFSKVVVNSTKGTKPAFEKEEPKIYVNNSEVTTTDTTSVTADKMTYVREFATPKTIPGTSDVTVRAEVKVNDKTLKSETAYKFVYPMYIGSIEAAIVSSFQNDLFISNNKLVVEKSNQLTTYNHDNKLTAFAYPASYGNLSKIVDQNGFDISGSFSSTSYVHDSIQYKVYYANNKNTLTNFKISYKF